MIVNQKKLKQKWLNIISAAGFIWRWGRGRGKTSVFHFIPFRTVGFFFFSFSCIVFIIIKECCARGTPACCPQRPPPHMESPCTSLRPSRRYFHASWGYSPRPSPEPRAGLQQWGGLSIRIRRTTGENQCRSLLSLISPPNLGVNESTVGTVDVHPRRPQNPLTSTGH